MTVPAAAVRSSAMTKILMTFEDGAYYFPKLLLPLARNLSVCCAMLYSSARRAVLCSGALLCCSCGHCNLIKTDRRSVSFVCQACMVLS